MQMNEYQRLSLRTWNTQIEKRDRILNAALGIAGEAGEVVELIKKHYFHGKDLDWGRLEEELGDVMYYISTLAMEFHILLDVVAHANVQKLETRYAHRKNPSKQEI